MAALMSCTSPCVFCGILGRSVTLIMDHGTMSRLMFGLIKATRPPRKMKEREGEADVCTLCCQKLNHHSLLCREGLLSTLVDLGGSLRQG